MVILKGEEKQEVWSISKNNKTTVSKHIGEENDLTENVK